MITIMSADGRVKCVVEEVEPGEIRYALWQHAGAIMGRAGQEHNAIMWRRIGVSTLSGLPWHAALDRLERCVRGMQHDRPIPRTAKRIC
jgi:hypothetical protein